MAEIGLIASVLQVADIGARLSITIYNSCRTAVNADDSIRFISKDVSHTSAILRELARCLEKDREAQLCSESTFHTTSAIVTECSNVFEELDLALMDKMMRMGLDEKSGQPNSAIFERSVWPFLQPKFNLLWNNLNKLKSTLHLTLNVLIYARQVAEKISPTPAADQDRVIMKHLLRLEVMIEEKNLKILREIRAVARSRPPALPLGSSPVPTDSPSSGTVRVLRATDMKTRTIEHYCDLMDSLLACVNFEDYDIGIESRRRIRNDLVQVHKRETRYLDGIYGAEALKDAMTGKYWKLADMDGASYPLACTMHNQSSCSRPELAEETAALEISKAAETTETKSWDTKTSNISPGDSILAGPKEVGPETSPQLLREEVEPLPEALFRPEVPITRISTSPLNSERLEAIDRKKWIPGNLSQSDGATRELSKCADPYDKGPRRKIATAENLDNCAVKILDQDTETREDSFEEVNPETKLTPLLQSGISKRPALGGGGYVEETDPLRRASIPPHNAHRKKLDPKFDNFVHSGAAPLPDRAKSREPAVPLKEVAEVPQQAVKSRPPITHAQSLPLNYAMEVFLEDQWENVTQKVAPNAGMPTPAWNEATSPDDSGTSVMVTQSSHTQKSVSTSQDLPGLTISSESSASSQAGL